MCTQMPDFVTKGYVHLDGFLDKDNCAELTVELRKLVAKGATTKDDQCPLSDAVHGAPVFDSLLEQLTPSFEQASGKRLHPTYAYARLYAPGDELKVHTDRPACEISATVTLGFEGKPWPIYMGDNPDKIGGSEIIMDVGDAVLYRGMEKHHWREKFEGKWQAQVFLHYVDADGPHADQKYDGREALAHQTNPVVDMTYWYLEDAISKDMLAKLMRGGDQNSYEKAEIGMGEDGVVNTEIRDVNKFNLPHYKGIGATMTGIGLNANAMMWNFDVTHSNQTDYLKYDKDGHYHAHTDTFTVKGEQDYRKLTVLAFLNDDFEGGKLFLQTGNEKIYPPQKAGTVLVFPSFILHGVEPVISGVRRSIVTWLVGPWFR